MKEQELSWESLYFDGNSRYYVESEEIVHAGKWAGEKIILPTVQRMTFINVEHLQI